jgi:precorrin-8X/cobalt-precorrin-8 methylmutase
MLPHEIEQESFRIIRAELGAHPFSAEELAVLVRVIHASGDFEFRDLLRFHPDAIRSAVDALHRGCTVVTDVRMVEVGISAEILSQFGGRTVCDIRHPVVREQAKALGLTRSTVAMRRNAPSIHENIVAIGNAPTALLEVLRLIREEGLRPALVVGVPVGFVNAAESKEELMSAGTPYITAVGRKGGSTIAVAIVNALLHLAASERTERAG